MSIKLQLEQVKISSRGLTDLSEPQIKKILHDLAALTLENIPAIIDENKKDLDQMAADDPKYDRLKLTEERIESIANDIIAVTDLKSPLHKVLEERKLENGLLLRKLTVPIGVIGIIYEARPNVTFDVFTLSLKSGNALVLKGGSDAHFSNLAIVKIIHQALESNHIDPNIVMLLPADRQATKEMLEAEGLIDIIIPRGSQNLIDFVRKNAKVPVIETGAGIVHTYVDASADIKIGADIIDNAKTRRVSVCNALDCLVIHQDCLKDLPKLTSTLAAKKVVLYADGMAYDSLQGNYPEELLNKAEEKHFGTEFLALILSIKTVSNLQEALDHIDQYSSKHSEAIIAEDQEVIAHYINAVDAAAVYINASTAFTDGGQFGMGAEIGISTQKLHARGPMGLDALVTYKWIVKGNGQIRQ